MTTSWQSLDSTLSLANEGKARLECKGEDECDGCECTYSGKWGRGRDDNNDKWGVKANITIDKIDAKDNLIF